ncbi:MAG: hypothetical protein M1825_000447 [Sarcosagium campestre]|nr:MAG: hypothetical protein M1825_000447 [Sarcosagium campestre]
MFFCFTFGTHDFSSPLKGYENVIVTIPSSEQTATPQAHPIKRWPWFTFCFVPVLPLSLKPYHEVSCPVCRFLQDMKHRPDIQSQGPGAEHHLGPPPPGQQQWSGPPPGQHQPPPQQGLLPQYK